MTMISQLKQRLSKYPHLTAFGLILLYLSLFQTAFMSTGDVWAEGYAEYLVTALLKGWSNFFHLGWAGYFNLIPKVLSIGYVSLHLPVAYIHYFFRATVVLYAAISAALVAAPYNRTVIKSDYLRIILAVATIGTLDHVSSFSFINSWYIGFVPVVMVSLNHQKLTFKPQVAYASFAVAACLTKPSIVLLPLVLYRAYKTREYFSGGLIALAIILQTAIMLASGYGGTEQTMGLAQRALTLVLGAGLLALKTINLYPVSFMVVMFASLALIATTAYLIKTKGLALIMVFGVAAGLSVYTYFFPPDVLAPDLFRQFQDIFRDDFKLQREITIAFFVLFLLFWAADEVIQRLKGRRAHQAIFAAMTAILILQYRPMDLQSASFAADISRFQPSLKVGQSICMPIPPMPAWTVFTGTPVGTWYFQYRGGCIAQNHDQTVDYGRFQAIGSGLTLRIPGSLDTELKSILLPVQNPSPHTLRQLVLINTDTQQLFPATVRAKTNGEELSFVSFNLVDDTPRESYNYLLVEQNTPSSDIRATFFSNNTPAYYAYFMGYPNLAEVTP